MFGLWKTADDQTRYPVMKSDADWRRSLSPSAYAVLRQEDTERPFTSPLNNEHRQGVFKCAGCNWPLYSSKTKFDSGTGWPSFWQPISNQAVLKRTDSSMLMIRTEVHCAHCGWTSWPRLQRRSPAYGVALLHERRGHDLPARRSIGAPGLRARIRTG